MSKMLDSLKAALGAGKPSPFVHVERELASLLGVSQDAVKDQRQALQLTRGADWELVKGAVTYTDPAAKKILMTLRVSYAPGTPAPDLAPNNEPDAPPAGGDDVPAGEDAEVVQLVCVKLPRNRRIILARLAADKQAPIVRVRVKDSGNFTIGMDLPAKKIGEDLYVLDGRRPRFPGKF